MSRQMNGLMKQIKKWVVNDYFTPNIKAEVILDMLLSEYIHELVEGAEFVTKEMSIPGSGQYGSSGAKIDYVLADGKKVYLVELKTTDSSINSKQTEGYLENCQGRFGDTLGKQLLLLLRNKKRTFHISLPNDAEPWNDKTLQNTFEAIVTKPAFIQDAAGESCTERARNLIRARRWTSSKKYRSRKYLYTLGQLADYIHDGGSLWESEMEIVYLTPSGSGPNGVSLRKFAAGLPARHPGDCCAQLLADIIQEIYGGT